MNTSYTEFIIIIGDLTQNVVILYILNKTLSLKAFNLLRRENAS